MSARKNSSSSSIGSDKSREKHVGYDDKSINDDDTCVVCFTFAKIFSIGECDHPVCNVCSARMRVLCKQNECPICRRDMSQVIFTNEKLPFRELEIKYRTGLYDKKYRIRFATSKSQQAFHKLLENRCPKCSDDSFGTFQDMRNHVRKEHEMFYCDLCTDNLKIFSSERKCYTRTELGMHRRVGDFDNKSHRGHPLCEYCDCRYLDKDELFRHMRREHYLCHICDADGQNQFYANISSMRDHYRKEHYLCEEGDCAQENFTSVFRTDIDLKAHIANVHGRTMSKLANKQARTLDLEFTLAPRNRQMPTDLSARFQMRQDPQHEFDIPDETFQTPMPVIDARNEQDFPSLGGAGSGMPGPSMFTMPSVSIRTKAFGSGGLARTKENFPALGKNNQTNASPVHTNNGYKQGMASAMLKTKSNTTQPVKHVLNQSEVVIHVSNRPTKQPEMMRGNAKDFPSLPGTSNNKKANLETDFVSPASAFAMSAIAAKHRNLVDGYESVGAESNSKLALVQKQQQQTAANGAAKKLIEKVPKLNSSEMFPALGGASGNDGSSTPAWLASTSAHRQQPVASKKSKVAPPPLSETTKSNQQNVTKKTDSNVKNNGKTTTAAAATKTTTAINGKKEKPQKTISNNKKENDLPSSAAAAKAAAKNQRKQRNSESFTEDESQFDLSNVFHAVSAKHRGMMFSYESHGADKKIATLPSSSSSHTSSVGTSTNIVESKKSHDKHNEKVPKLNSLGLFPSLNKKQKNLLENNNNNTIMTTKNLSNFAEMIKKENATTKIETKNKDANDNTSETVSQKDSNDDDNDDVDDNQSGSSLTALNGPPPGFGSSVAPPGFQSVTVNSIVKPLNDLTFTTSLGESFNNIPTYFYMAPPNAVLRNQELVTHFHSILKKSDAVEQFKQISQNFMMGTYNPLPYYEHCISALDNKFEEIFPELLALLPDISKQQELYLVHTQHTKGVSTRKIPLDVCSICKQVLSNSDSAAHAQMHILESNFPTL